MDWHILVVEDLDDDIHMASKVLRHNQVQVTTARNGLECLQTLEKIEPTAIIMDLAMPDMNGWETLVEIRANPATAHIPVIAMTAYGSSRVEADALDAGFNGYLPKPIKPTQFIAQIEAILQG